MELRAGGAALLLLLLGCAVQYMLLVVGATGEHDESLSGVLVATPASGGARLGIPRLSYSTILLALGGAAVLLAASLPRYGCVKVQICSYFKQLKSETRVLYVKALYIHSIPQYTHIY